MTKDQRYDTIKFLIEGGRIKKFSQIFEHIPKSVVANDMGTNYNRLAKLIEHVDHFTLKELFMIGNFFDIDEDAILKLAMEQYKVDKKNKHKN